MADKYIIIPEYKPLYAMRYCFGPTHGPLEKPCPTPIDVIGKLLLQTGNEKLSIYEVKVDPKTRKTIGEPIKLTLDNYKKPYDELVGKVNKNVTLGKELVFDKKAEPVVFKPVREEPKEDSAIVTPVKEESLVETKTLEEKLAEIPEEEPDEIDEAMIQEAEKDTDTETIPLEEVKKDYIETGVVTDAAFSDGSYSNSTTTYVEPGTPVDVPFITGTVVGEMKVTPEDFVTVSSSDNYIVPVTTSEGTKMLDTGMSEAEYKALSKSERRRLRKSLAENSSDEITDEEAQKIEDNTPM